MKNAYAVIGANFGDEGKGLMVDYYAAQSPEDTAVVLFNGGAQRGHTVVTPEGYRHVFHHFGSGSLAGAVTYFAEDFIVNPCLFRQEYEKLEKRGFSPYVYINKNCLMTTIYDMLINQALEANRGASKHGSCGVGIYETLYRNQAGLDFKNPFCFGKLNMTVGDFYTMKTLDKINFLDHVRKAYVEKRFDSFRLSQLDPQLLKVLTSDIVITNFLEDYDFMMERCVFADDDLVFTLYDTVIFEAGQGLLLDQHNMDYFPHLTPSNTGLTNIVKMLKNYGWTDILEACYVSRTYATRHGVGKLPRECKKSDINPNMIDITNVPNPWQDELRYGFLDFTYLSARTNKDVEDQHAPFHIEKKLAITHINEFNPPQMMKSDPYYLSFGLTREQVVVNSWYTR